MADYRTQMTRSDFYPHTWWTSLISSSNKVKELEILFLAQVGRPESDNKILKTTAKKKMSRCTLA